jgi:hypothetical protein
MGMNDLGLMFMWWHRIKLSTFSREFEYLPEKKQEGWKVLRYCVGYSIEENRIYEAG